jgi:hypothetical protein
VDKDARITFALPVTAYALVFLVDVSMHTLLCVKLHLARIMGLPVLEAIKLRVEFLVLNLLLEVGKAEIFRQTKCKKFVVRSCAKY